MPTPGGSRPPVRKRAVRLPTPSRLRALGSAVLLGATVLALPGGASATAAEPESRGLAAQVAQLNRDIERVGDELAAGAVAYESAATRLGRLTQEQFAATADAESLARQAVDSRASLNGLARAAYKGGVPPMVKAILTGDPRNVADLAYVQKSINLVGGDRRELVRATYLQQAGAGRRVVQSDAARREALRQKSALDDQLAALTARADQLTAQLVATAAKLEQARAGERAAAMRAAQAAAALAAASTGVPTGAGAGCQPPSPVGEVNGFLSPAGLCWLEVGRGHRLRTDAAQAFNLLGRAYAAALGTPICVTDSYRSYAEQVAVFKAKPGLAATPGRSQHGWGLAVDLCGGVQSFDSPAHLWLAQNAPAFGWVHPEWAQRGGSKPEPWHWEYVGG